MVNINKLRGKMVENGIKVSELAAVLNMNTATLYRKLESGNFTVKEAQDIAKTLKLNIDDVNNIFFAETVA